MTELQIKGQELRRWFGTIMILSLFSLAAVARADAPAPAPSGPTLGGFVDTTYNYDTNRPKSRLTAMRSFDRKTDNFLLNAIQVNLTGGKDGIGYFAALDYGTDASNYKSAGTNSPNEPAYTAPSNTPMNFDIQQAYLTYKCPTTAIQLKAGKFVTYEGIEVINSKDDYEITRGDLFNLGEPFTHVGAMIGYTFPKYINFMMGLVNGWDEYTSNNYGKMFHANIGITLSDNYSGSVTFMRGPAQAGTTNNARTSFDVTWSLHVVDPLTIGLQFNGGEEEGTSVAIDRAGAAGHWYGLGIQPLYNFTKKFGLGSRIEWFSDLDGSRTGTPQVKKNITLAPVYNLTDNLMARVEYRYDWSTRLVYETSDGVFSKGETSTFSTELIYKF